MSILLYGCTTWTLTNRMEKKLDGNCTRMLWTILNKSRKQHPTKQHLYGNLHPISKTIQIRRIRHAGYCWRSKGELISDIFLLTLSYGQDTNCIFCSHTLKKVCRIASSVMFLGPLKFRVFQHHTCSPKWPYRNYCSSRRPLYLLEVYLGEQVAQSISIILFFFFLLIIFYCLFCFVF